MKAIETRYKGFCFRSRLEARWAVCFDAMQWTWKYEPQGYEVDGDCYLPDFWVDQLGCWVEVKGSPDEPGMRRLVSVSMALPLGDQEDRQKYRPVKRKILILGEIPDPLKAWAHLLLGVTDSGVPAWQRVTLHAGGSLPFSDWIVTNLDFQPMSNLAAWTGGWEAHRVIPSRAASDAYLSGRSARFEHGQKGAV